MECSVTCVTCTKDDDAPMVLVAEEADHAEVGADHHEWLGACFAAASRHLIAYPEHVLTFMHETPAEVAKRIRDAEEKVQRRRDALGVVDPSDSIRRRRLRMEQPRRPAGRGRNDGDPLDWATRGG